MLLFPCRRKERRVGSIQRVSSLPSHEVAVQKVTTHFDVTTSFALPESGLASCELSDQIE